MSDSLINRIDQRVARITQRYSEEQVSGRSEFEDAVHWRRTEHTIPVCPALEFHAAHGCNLGCDHCSHYSNYLTGQNVTAIETEQMFSDWHGRIFAPKLKILGGEPLLNPEVCEILKLARRYWPDSRIVLHTNGLLLNKFSELPDLLREHRIHLMVTMHSKETAYLRSFERILDTIEDWNVSLYVSASINFWRQTTNGVGSAMRPWHSEPRAAWEACLSKYAVQLHANRLWKCPQIAYLPLALKPYQLHQLAEWQPFLDYVGLSPDCTDDELRDFLTQEDESICSMCSREVAYVEKDIRKRLVS